MFCRIAHRRLAEVDGAAAPDDVVAVNMETQPLATERFLLGLTQRLEEVNTKLSQQLSQLRESQEALNERVKVQQREIAQLREQGGKPGRTLDADDDLHVTDAVGALVLAESGQAHLERALGSARDRRRDPARPCFFNPLHGAAKHAVKLPGDADTRVPACAACAKSVRAGRQPQALMVRTSGTTAPYYETDPQPWAATGYGSIDPDWVDKVLTRGVNP